mgnify:CR=1 FL=1
MRDGGLGNRKDKREIANTDGPFRQRDEKANASRISKPARKQRHPAAGLLVGEQISYFNYARTVFVRSIRSGRV